MEHRISPGVEAIEKLEDFIVVNRLAPNTRIPSERDLCEMWGISRSTLRQAVDALVDRGTLYRVHGTGVYVAMSKKNRNMVGVDAMIGEMRQQGYALSKRIISRRTLEATKQISRKLRCPLGSKVYEYIRVRKVDYMPCILETTYIECRAYPDFDGYYSDKTSMDYIFKNVYGKKETAGEEHISVTYATEFEEQWLECQQGSPLFFASGVVTDQFGEPMQYYKQIFRADQFKFVSTISDGA